MADMWGNGGGGNPWNGGFADFIRQYDPNSRQMVGVNGVPQAPHPRTADDSTQTGVNQGSSWWGAPSVPSGMTGVNAAPDPSQTGVNHGASWYTPAPQGGVTGGYAPAPQPQGGLLGLFGDNGTTAPQGHPGQTNGSYFPNNPGDPNNDLNRALFDQNPTLAWQHLVSQTVSNPNSPQYAWARAQYQRYYNDYTSATATNPNLTFTQYLDQQGPNVAAEFGNAPASARGVTNVWQNAGRYTS